MPEPRKPIVMAGISTRQLERAAIRLASARYPVRLQVIDEELQVRKAQEKKAA